jgi:membrane protein implicated in regulation of membrane protease activity
MCFVVMVILGVFAFNAFAAGHLLLGSLALAGALIFAVVMLQNIIAVRRRMKKKNQEGQHDNRYPCPPGR